MISSLPPDVRADIVRRIVYYTEILGMNLAPRAFVEWADADAFGEQLAAEQRGLA